MNRFHKQKKIEYNGTFLTLNFVSEKEKNAFLHASTIVDIIQNINETNKKTPPIDLSSSDNESSDSDLDDTPMMEDKKHPSSLKLEILKISPLSEDEQNQIIKALEINNFFPKPEIDALKKEFETLRIKEEADKKFCLYIRRHR